MISPPVTGLAFVLLICIFGIRRILHARAYPSAPGPQIASWTGWWYLWKSYEGKFEQWALEQHARHGKIVRVAPNMYSISDPASLQIIYGGSSAMPKAAWYDAWGVPGSRNLFNVRDRTLSVGMRRRAGPFYTASSIMKYEPYIDQCIDLLVAQFDHCVLGKKEFDLQHWMRCYAFDVIGEITFGSRVGFLESGGQDIEEIIAGLDKTNTIMTVVAMDNNLAIPFALANTTHINTLSRWTDKSTNVRAKMIADGKYPDKQDFVTKLTMIEEKDPEDYNRHKMDSILMSNIAAGSDTTSATLTAAIFYLSTNPTVLQKLRYELENVRRQEANGPIKFEVAQKLPYLELVIKETMRMWPAVGLPLWREVQAPGATIAGRFFPAGAVIGVDAWVFHRDPDVFGPDPNVFRPERWIVSPAEQLKDMEKSYMPFGLGSRACLGKNISMLEMMKLIPELVQRYDFTMVQQQMKSTNHWFIMPKDVFAHISFRHTDVTDEAK